MSKDLIIEEEKQEKKKRFNTNEALKSFLGKFLKEGERNWDYEIITSKAKKKAGTAAKDTGKTFLVMLKMILNMERDPMAACLGLRKYGTNAAKRLGGAFLKVYRRLKSAGFHFPHDYHKSQQFIYRQVDKRNNTMNQSIEFTSFEDEDGLSGIDVANGGYISLIHVEEPVNKKDAQQGTTTPDGQFTSSIKVIDNSSIRTVRDYSASKPKFPPIPFEWWFTMNNWSGDHYLTKLLEKYIPLEKFLNKAIGMHYQTLLGNRTLVEKYWPKIRASLLENYIWVEDMLVHEGETYCLFRKTVFSNPTIRNYDLIQKEIDEAQDNYAKEVAQGAYDNAKQAFDLAMFEIKEGLATNDITKLAVHLGDEWEGDDDNIKVHNFYELNRDIDTMEVLEEKGRQTLGLTIGIDIDVDRRLVMTPVTISAMKINHGNPFEPNWGWANHKICVHKQFVIPAYGKGEGGRNNKIYQSALLQHSARIVEEFRPYLNKNANTRIFVDDNQGAGFLLPLQLLSDNNIVDYVGDFEKNGNKHGRIARQNRWQQGIDTDIILIDKNNQDLFEFLTKVNKNVDTGVRIEKGKYEALADFVNSAEGGLQGYVDAITNMLRHV